MEQGTTNFCCDQSHGKSSVLHSHTIPLHSFNNKIDGSCFFTFAFAKAKKQRAFFSIEKIDTIWEIYCQIKKTVNTWKFSEGKLIVSSDQSQ